MADDDAWEVASAERGGRAENPALFFLGRGGGSSRGVSSAWVLVVSLVVFAPRTKTQATAAMMTTKTRAPAARAMVRNFLIFEDP